MTPCLKDAVLENEIENRDQPWDLVYTKNEKNIEDEHRFIEFYTDISRQNMIACSMTLQLSVKKSKALHYTY